MASYYTDANGTDGSNPSLMDAVWPDGTRIRLSDTAAVQAKETAWANGEANAADVRLRFAAHALKGKTPAQIYTLVQGRIDSWSNLAAAKADLRDWLPLLAAGLAWMVMERDDR